MPRRLGKARIKLRIIKRTVLQYSAECKCGLSRVMKHHSSKARTFCMAYGFNSYRDLTERHVNGTRGHEFSRKRDESARALVLD